MRHLAPRFSSGAGSGGFSPRCPRVPPMLPAARAAMGSPSGREFLPWSKSNNISSLFFPLGVMAY